MRKLERVNLEGAKIKHGHEEEPAHGHSLAEDLTRLRQQALNRRQAFAWLGAAGLIPLVSCGSDNKTAAAGTTTTADGTSTATTTASTATSTTSSGVSGTCALIPEETEGPYPGDGSNGVNALALSGIIRSDITSSFDGVSGVAAGVPLTVELSLVNLNGSCGALEGYAIYIWHCDQSGNYSLYSGSAKNLNYLRGVQVTDADGKVAFTSIFPGCYSGRWPHIHFEIYKTASDITSARNKVATSQLALPADQAKLVYATSGYTGSSSNLSKISLATDNVFSDGSSLQIPTIEGDVTSGFTIKLTVAIKA